MTSHGREWSGALLPAALVVVWEVLARGGVVDARYIVPPSAVAATLLSEAASGALVAEVAITLQRLAAAFVLAVTAGVLLGFAIAASPFVAALTRPVIDTLYPTPKIALLPLLIIILGLGEAAFVATAFATAFFQITIATVAAIRHVDQQLVEAGRNFGAVGPRLYRRVLLPAAAPAIVSGLRVGIGLCLITLVAVEFVAAGSGLGHLIQLAWQQLNVDVMYAGLVVSGLLGHAISLAFRAAERRLFPWQPADPVRARAGL